MINISSLTCGFKEDDTAGHPVVFSPVRLQGVYISLLYAQEVNLATDIRTMLSRQMWAAVVLLRC